MINCIVIDDEPVAIEILRDYIQKTPFLELLNSFRNPLKALEYLKEHKVDLIFLDINMPDLSGIQFLESLIHHPLIIFTTAYSQYAVESYEYDAIDYLLKPIEFVRFIKAANRALEHLKLKAKESYTDIRSTENNTKGKDDLILIKSGTHLHKIRLTEILYIQGAGNYVIYFTAEKKIMSLMSMNETINKLQSDVFIRIHKSYIINTDHVEVIEKEQVKINNKFIPIGETYRNGFLNKMSYK
ncbi:LytR/AlgR family response regulator transcription factor [Bacteroidota bacterium]